MDSLPFSRKIALIIRSGRGIGKAIALHFARQGRYRFNFFPQQRLGRDHRALLVKADIGDLDDLGRLFYETEKAFGGLDFYIHNTASGYNRPALEQKPKGWD